MSRTYHRQLSAEERAAIDNAIQELGFDAGDFAWEERTSSHHESKLVQTVIYKPLGFSIVFEWFDELPENHCLPSPQHDFEKESAEYGKAITGYTSPSLESMDIKRWLAVCKEARSMQDDEK
jgi:hypothetical protein